jgi:receptor protein-tyrosine kinase
MINNESNRNEKYTGNEQKSLAEIIASFLRGFKKLWWFAVLCMLVVGIVGYLSYKKSYVPTYQSKATFTITAPEYDGTDQSYTNDSQLASVLSVSFDYLINNEVFYQIIEEDIGVNYMPSVLTISAVEETNILSITASGSDAEMNLKVINSVIENYASVAEFVLGDTEITVLEQPVVAQHPVNAYSPVTEIIKFGFIGFVLGLIPSIFYAFFIKTIHSTEDIEKYLSVGCFGGLPAVLLNKKESNFSNCSILNKEVGFRYLEAMRTVSSRCEKELIKKNCKVILITSTQENEGKSTFAMNLAYSLSKAQKRVMLIDGDLRKPSLRTLTKSELPSYSMEQFLNKKIKGSEAVINLNATRVLLLAPDEVTANPIECLNSENMSKFIEESRDVVDYVIIDAPPCSKVSDAAVLAKYSDGVIYVVREDDAKVNKILDSIQEFSYTRVPILGCVLNGTAGKLRLSYGYGYGYGYSKYYSYGKYGYGRYGYGKYGYGYGEYGEVSDKEFQGKSRKVSSHITLKTTDEQKAALEQQRLLEETKQDEKNTDNKE